METREKVLPDIIPNIGFNLEAQEQFAKDKGIVFEHWAAIPSTIGQKDIGEYRRSDTLDTISSNGFIYKKVGEFTGTILGNSKGHNFIEGGLYDHSTARLMLPKFYNEGCSAENQEISLLPGDRIYAKGIEVNVSNYEKNHYTPRGEDILQFPVKCVDFLQDSNNKEYISGRHFNITSEGNIKWIAGKANPGIDPETGRGRAYGVRYRYVAFWYVEQLINEVRITNEGDAENPSRMPYHVTIQREYVYHNKKRGNPQTTNIEATHDERTIEEPKEELNPQKYDIKVDIRNFE